MEALQDKRVRLQPSAERAPGSHQAANEYAARYMTCSCFTLSRREEGGGGGGGGGVAPAEGFSELAAQVMMSPSKTYILTVIGASVALLFLMGLFCGRFIRRVAQELKDRFRT
ncbi:Golgi apparatus protein 1-like isoform X3, partial [Lates japonicus]